MINSANIVDINSGDDDKRELFPQRMVPLEKLNRIHTPNIPQSNANFFSNCSESLYKYAYTTEEATASSFSPKTKVNKPKEHEIVHKKRAKDEHLARPVKLPNTGWNKHTFSKLSADERMETPNSNNNNNNIPNECAFIKHYTMDEKNPTAISAAESTNNNNSTQTAGVIVGEPPMVDSETASDRHIRMSLIQRTEDQENAFRRIEDVHNYAKLNRYSYSNGSSNSSVHEDEDDDEDNNNGEDFIVDNSEDVDTNYESYFSRTQPQTGDKFKTNRRLIAFKSPSEEFGDNEVHVDVETVQVDSNEMELRETATPDHHARRPMNAFLIFCKRHRAIVKERYKSLENRAITKILGDWWASLEVNDKQCFTNLAQQNKDAFFSANPNFKWYKLPAPPLRTLNTRPSNAERVFERDLGEDFEPTMHNLGKSRTDNYFKLADEAHMGELSVLMSDKTNVAHCALQQALGETTHFLSTHMPQSTDMAQKKNKESSFKRRLPCDHSFSSNSSEDDTIPKKSSRSCKGKIYQELINSGQIATTTKKIKAPKGQNSVQPSEQSTFLYSETVADHQQPGLCSSLNSSDTAQLAVGNALVKHSVVETESLHGYELAKFDLEVKIKELPALSLDAYLQRKRSTKKKKKFNSKKRASNSTSSGKDLPCGTPSPSPPTTPTTAAKSIRDLQPQQAIGSQKRKARKESITRRDVSAIENEVASLIPLRTDFATINGCYYFNNVQAAAMAATADKSAPSSSSSSINQLPNDFRDCSDNISSTSDLLILAEVAANRTELTN